MVAAHGILWWLSGRPGWLCDAIVLVGWLLLALAQRLLSYLILHFTSQLPSQLARLQLCRTGMQECKYTAAGW